jgi:tetratricopeptide (TPR) repeat protein
LQSLALLLATGYSLAPPSEHSMTTTRLVIALSLLYALVTPRVVFADESSLLAKEHFRRGTKLYDLGHYPEAAAEYEQAYQAKDSPALLYNLGQAYRLGGQPERALASYRSYLRNMPNAENRDEVMAFIETLKKTIEAQKAAKEKPPTDTLQPPATDKPALVTRPETPPPAVVEPPAAAPVDDRPRTRTLEIAGLGVGAVGVASLAAGAAFAGLTASTNNKLNHPAAGATFDKSLADRGATFQTLEGVFFAVGGAALVTGVVVYAVGAKRARAATHVVPVVGPSTAGASLSFDF